MATNPKANSALAPDAAKVRIRFGHSPDPDDAFMFYAIAKRKISTGRLEIEHVIEDIESLNQRALRGELEATAVSVHAYAHLADAYALMACGASMGEDYGPIVVARRALKPAELRGLRIAIPGKLTTAALALKLFASDFEEVVIPFDQILTAVAERRVDAGLLIHEGQITYGTHGLRKIVDLGAWWRETTGLPLPLGVDVVRRNLGRETMRELSKVFRRSIEYALAHREDALSYALEFGRGLSRDLGDRFVGMYVNNFTLDLGERGRRAIETLLARGGQAGLIPSVSGLDIV